MGSQTNRPPTQHTLEIQAEQIRILYRQCPSALIAIAVNAVILGSILWEEVSRSLLISWLVVVSLLTLGRYLLLQAYRRANPAPTEALCWGRWFVIGEGLSGLSWGSAGAFLFPEQSYFHQVLIGFVLAGMSAGAMSYLSSFPGAYTMFLVPAVLPYAARLMVPGGDIAIAMGMMSLLFIVLMRIMSHRVHASVIESLRLRFDNLDLLNELTVAKEHQEAINRELQAEIAERGRAEEALRARTRQLMALTYLGHQVLSRVTISELMKETANLIARTLEVQYVQIWELLSDRKTLLPRAATRWPEALLDRMMTVIDRDTPADSTLVSNEPVVIEDLSLDPRFRKLSLLNEYGLASGVSFQFGSRGNPLGILCVYMEQGRVLTSDDMNFLRSAAHILALAIEHQQTETRMHKLQNELVHVSRFSAMDELGTALAHELNQPLPAVMTYVT